ncbi:MULTISPECIES: helix-turn-helix domain-containing protein [unclassified Streptomyces]|uniref:helix-turn-helix domain-containing protein n=1 Tax=unclassified Streptomyces TaxID=2593676 RepID=UPI00278C536C|nr:MULTISPECIES: helix-turn-helix domain-containing protein [unclassified Streptomyces]
MSKREGRGIDATTYLELLSEEAPRSAFCGPVAEAKSQGVDGAALQQLMAAERYAYDVWNLSDQRRRRVSGLSTLVDAARDLLGAPDVNTVLDLITRWMRIMLHLDMSYVALHDPESDTDIVRSVDGHASVVTPEFPVPSDSGLGSSARRGAAPFSTPDYLADSGIWRSHKTDEAVRLEGLRAVIVVPLTRSDGAHLGLLYGGCRAVRHFEAGEHSLAGELGQLAAMALTTALEREQDRARAQGLAADVQRAEEERENVLRLRGSQEVLMDLIVTGGGVDRFLSVARELLDADVRFEETSDIAPAAGAAVSQEEDGVWTAPVRGTIAFGRLVLRRLHPPSELDMMLLQACAQTLAALLQIQPSGTSEDDLLEVLLVSEPGGGQLSQHRARAVGPDLTNPHIVVVAKPEGGLTDGVRSWATVYARQSGGLRSHREGHVVFLLPGTDPGATARGVADSAAAVTGLRITAGAAGPSTDADTVPGLYKQAQRCLHAVATLGAAGGVATPQDLGGLELLLADQQDVAGFIEAAIGPLLEHDERRSTDLVPTLEAYYAANSSPRRAGEQLFVHANTITRRLERINDLLGSRWQEGTGALEVQLAVRMHRIRSNIKVTDE